MKKGGNFPRKGGLANPSPIKNQRCKEKLIE
jgi:hypothetical protein